MSDYRPSPEFEKLLRQAVSVPDPAPEFVEDLQTRLSQEDAKMIPKPRRLTPRLAWALAAALILFIIVMLANSPTVVEAMKRIYGYIPGVGMVDQNATIRVLAEPVSQTREGVTVRVEEVFLDANRMVLTFQFDGVSMETVPKGETAPGTYCSEQALIRLPDGQELRAGMGWGTGWGSGVEYHFEFDPIPAEIDEVVFVVPCLMGTLSGSAPENWEFHLQFIPAPPDLTIYPVIEIPTPTPSQESYSTSGKTADPTSLPTKVLNSPSVKATQPATETGLPSSQNTIYLTLDRAVQMEDSYILYATFYSEKDQYTFVSPGMPKLLDADGNTIPIEFADPDFSGASDPQQHPMTVKALGDIPSGPLTIQIDDAHAELPVDAQFSFNVGSNPQPGDVWELDQTVDVLDYTLTILSVQAIDSHGHLGFEITFDPGMGIESARLIDPDHPLRGGGGGGGGGSTPKNVRTTLLYDGDLPTGEITMAVESISLKLQGPWQATWTPTENMQGIQGNTSALEQASCLTSESWALAKQQSQSLPSVWAGKLAHYGPVSEDEDWHISVLSLDDNSEQSIGRGTWPDLSPDGNHLVYAGREGLYVVDLVNGEEKILLGTNENDYNPIWSPDGTQIAFVRGEGDFDIFLIRANGTNLQRITSGPTHEILGGWLPDGQHLIFAEPNTDGLLLRLLDIHDGNLEDLFPIQGVKDLSIAISPDGRRLAYLESIFGYKRGLFISDLDGANRHFFGNTDTEVFSDPLWSPDGRWLLISIWDEQVNDVLPFLALVQVENCQIIPLPDLTGQFSSWVP
jgi:hypothetical protein